MSVRLYAMTCGYLTLPIEFLVGGLRGMLSVPVPRYLAERLKGSPIVDTGLQKILQGT